MNSTYFITPIAGAVIGYLTNWIAIKMLFRPHNEVRFFGVRLPFTPGLIPKEREALAKKVGEAVSEHVITTDVLVDAVVSPESMESLNFTLSTQLKALQKSQLTVEEQLALLLGPDWDTIISVVETGAMNVCGDILNHTSFQQEIARLVTERVVVFLQNESLTGYSEKVIRYLKPVLVSQFSDFFGSDDFKEMVERNINLFYNGLLENENLVSHYISEKNVLDMKAYIRKEMPRIAGFLRNVLTDDSELDLQLNLLTRRVIDENIGTLAKMFLNKDSVYASIKEGLITFLSDETQYDMLAEKLWQRIDAFMVMDVRSLAQKLPERQKEQILQKVIQIAEKSVGENITDKVLAFIEAQLQKSEKIYLFDIIQKFQPDAEVKLNQFFFAYVSEFCTKKAPVLLKDFIANMKTKLLSTPVSALAEKINGDSAKNIKQSIWKAVELLLKKGAYYVVKNVDIGKMVEEQVNKFEVDEAEKIVVSVVNRELSAITVLGGVLGFIIGIVTVLLQMI